MHTGGTIRQHQQRFKTISQCRDTARIMSWFVLVNQAHITQPVLPDSLRNVSHEHESELKNICRSVQFDLQTINTYEAVTVY